MKIPNIINFQPNLSNLVTKDYKRYINNVTET